MAVAKAPEDPPVLWNQTGQLELGQEGPSGGGLTFIPHTGGHHGRIPGREVTKADVGSRSLALRVPVWAQGDQGGPWRSGTDKK